MDNEDIGSASNIFLHHSYRGLCNLAICYFVDPLYFLSIHLGKN